MARIKKSKATSERLSALSKAVALPVIRVVVNLPAYADRLGVPGEPELLARHIAVDKSCIVEVYVAVSP